MSFAFGTAPPIPSASKVAGASTKEQVSRTINGERSVSAVLQEHQILGAITTPVEEDELPRYLETTLQTGEVPDFFGAEGGVEDFSGGRSESGYAFETALATAQEHLRPGAPLFTFTSASKGENKLPSKSRDQETLLSQIRFLTVALAHGLSAEHFAVHSYLVENNTSHRREVVALIGKLVRELVGAEDNTAESVKPLFSGANAGEEKTTEATPEDDDDEDFVRPSGRSTAWYKLQQQSQNRKKRLFAAVCLEELLGLWLVSDAVFPGYLSARGSSGGAILAAADPDLKCLAESLLLIPTHWNKLASPRATIATQQLSLNDCRRIAVVATTVLLGSIPSEQLFAAVPPGFCVSPDATSGWNGSIADSTVLVGEEQRTDLFASGWLPCDGTFLDGSQFPLFHLVPFACIPRFIANQEGLPDEVSGQIVVSLVQTLEQQENENLQQQQRQCPGGGIAAAAGTVMSRQQSGMEHSMVVSPSTIITDSFMNASVVVDNTGVGSAKGPIGGRYHSKGSLRIQPLNCFGEWTTSLSGTVWHGASVTDSIIRSTCSSYISKTVFASSKGVSVQFWQLFSPSVIKDFCALLTTLAESWKEVPDGWMHLLQVLTDPLVKKELQQPQSASLLGGTIEVASLVSFLNALPVSLEYLDTLNHELGHAVSLRLQEEQEEHQQSYLSLGASPATPAARRGSSSGIIYQVAVHALNALRKTSLENGLSSQVLSTLDLCKSLSGLLRTLSSRRLNMSFNQPTPNSIAIYEMVSQQFLRSSSAQQCDPTAARRFLSEALIAVLQLLRSPVCLPDSGSVATGASFTKISLAIAWHALDTVEELCAALVDAADANFLYEVILRPLLYPSDEPLHAIFASLANVVSSCPNTEELPATESFFTLLANAVSATPFFASGGAAYTATGDPNVSSQSVLLNVSGSTILGLDGSANISAAGAEPRRGMAGSSRPVVAMTLDHLGNLLSSIEQLPYCEPALLVRAILRSTQFHSDELLYQQGGGGSAAESKKSAAFGLGLKAFSALGQIGRSRAVSAQVSDLCNLQLFFALSDSLVELLQQSGSNVAVMSSSAHRALGCLCECVSLLLSMMPKEGFCFSKGSAISRRGARLVLALLALLFEADDVSAMLLEAAAGLLIAVLDRNKNGVFLAVRSIVDDDEELERKRNKLHACLSLPQYTDDKAALGLRLQVLEALISCDPKLAGLFTEPPAHCATLTALTLETEKDDGDTSTDKGDEKEKDGDGEEGKKEPSKTVPGEKENANESEEDLRLRKELLSLLLGGDAFANEPTITQATAAGRATSVGTTAAVDVAVGCRSNYELEVKAFALRNLRLLDSALLVPKLRDKDVSQLMRYIMSLTTAYVPGVAPGAPGASSPPEPLRGDNLSAAGPASLLSLSASAKRQPSKNELLLQQEEANYAMPLKLRCAAISAAAEAMQYAAREGVKLAVAMGRTESNSEELEKTLSNLLKVLFDPGLGAIAVLNEHISPVAARMEQFAKDATSLNATESRAVQRHMIPLRVGPHYFFGPFVRLPGDAGYNQCKSPGSLAVQEALEDPDVLAKNEESVISDAHFERKVIHTWNWLLSLADTLENAFTAASQGLACLESILRSSTSGTGGSMAIRSQLGVYLPRLTSYVHSHLACALHLNRSAPWPEPLGLRHRLFQATYQRMEGSLLDSLILVAELEEAIRTEIEMGELRSPDENDLHGLRIGGLSSDATRLLVADGLKALITLSFDRELGQDAVSPVSLRALAACHTLFEGDVARRFVAKIIDSMDTVAAHTIRLIRKGSSGKRGGSTPSSGSSTTPAPKADLKKQHLHEHKPDKDLPPEPSQVSGSGSGSSATAHSSADQRLFFFGLDEVCTPTHASHEWWNALLISLMRALQYATTAQLSQVTAICLSLLAHGYLPMLHSSSHKPWHSFSLVYPVDQLVNIARHAIQLYPLAIFSAAQPDHNSNQKRQSRLQQELARLNQSNGKSPVDPTEMLFNTVLNTDNRKAAAARHEAQILGRMLHEGKTPLSDFWHILHSFSRYSVQQPTNVLEGHVVASTVGHHLYLQTLSLLETTSLGILKHTVLGAGSSHDEPSSSARTAGERTTEGNGQGSSAMLGHTASGVGAGEAMLLLPQSSLALDSSMMNHSMMNHSMMLTTSFSGGDSIPQVAALRAYIKMKGYHLLWHRFLVSFFLFDESRLRNAIEIPVKQRPQGNIFFYELQEALLLISLYVLALETREALCIEAVLPDVGEELRHGFHLLRTFRADKIKHGLQVPGSHPHDVQPEAGHPELIFVALSRQLTELMLLYTPAVCPPELDLGEVLASGGTTLDAFGSSFDQQHLGVGGGSGAGRRPHHLLAVERPWLSLGPNQPNEGRPGVNAAAGSPHQQRHYDAAAMGVIVSFDHLREYLVQQIGTISRLRREASRHSEVPPTPLLRASVCGSMLDGHENHSSSPLLDGTNSIFGGGGVTILDGGETTTAFAFSTDESIQQHVQIVQAGVMVYVKHLRYFELRVHGASYRSRALLVDAREKFISVLGRVVRSGTHEQHLAALLRLLGEIHELLMQNPPL